MRCGRAIPAGSSTARARKLLGRWSPWSPSPATRTASRGPPRTRAWARRPQGLRKLVRDGPDSCRRLAGGGLAGLETGHGDSYHTQYRSPVFIIPVVKKVEFARVYVAAAGCAHVEVNGHVPLPDLRGICPWPVDTASVRFVTHHLTDDDTNSSVPHHGITLGERNVVGVIAGHVMKAPQFIALVMVKFVGEAPFFLSTSSSGWTSTARTHVVAQPTAGISTHATSYVGAWETTIDWTKYQPGWSTPAFKPDSGGGWTPAAAPISATGTNAVSARGLAMPLSTVLAEVLPDKVTALPGGDFLYHFPKNFVGTLRIKNGPAATGAKLSVLLGEWLLPNKPVEPAPLPPPAPPQPPPPPPGPPSHCGRVISGRMLNLGCAAGSTIDKILFVSFGTPGGNCTTGFKKWFAGPYAPRGDSICSDSIASLAVLQKACLGKHECSVMAPDKSFPTGKDPCTGVHKILAAEVHCTGDPPSATCKGSCYDNAPPPAPEPPRKPPHPLVRPRGAVSPKSTSTSSSAAAHGKRLTKSSSRLSAPRPAVALWDSAEVLIPRIPTERSAMPTPQWPRLSRPASGRAAVC